MTRHNRRGMTLMELLVVTIILGLLMSLGLGIGSALLIKADRQKTIGTMAIVMGAIDVYYEQCGAYPPQKDENDVTYPYSDYLLTTLKLCPAAQKALSALDQQAMNEGAECGYAFIDGFNMPIRYLATGGLGGAPQLSSAGPDGKYNNADDITSESE
jgi:prepilin-type N-terminal cleavage/methylation domain-containing protein